MSVKHRIEDYVPILYNVMFKEPEECYGHSCGAGKCICMDSEQMGLLCKLLSEDDQIAMNFTGERVVFQNLQSKPIERWICQQVPKTEKLNSETFFIRDNLFGEEETEEGLKKLIERECAFLDVIKSIPIIYKTNYSNDIKDRDTLINLCAYAACSEKYLHILFRAVICKTIGCCQKAKDQQEKEQYAAELARMFKKLNSLFKKSNDIRESLSVDIEGYISAWRVIENNDVKAIIRNICSVLEEYRGEVKQAQGNLLQVYEKGKCEKLYCILKKILGTANVSTKSFPKLEFDASKQNGTEYDEIVSILDEVKDNDEKLSRIWSELSQVFWYDVEVSSESIERMQKISRE